VVGEEEEEEEEEGGKELISPRFFLAPL